MTILLWNKMGCIDCYESIYMTRQQCQRRQRHPTVPSAIVFSTHCPMAPHGAGAGAVSCKRALKETCSKGYLKIGILQKQSVFNPWEGMIYEITARLVPTKCDLASHNQLCFRASSRVKSLPYPGSAGRFSTKRFSLA